MADIRVVDGLICGDERQQFKLKVTWKNMNEIRKTGLLMNI
jgi:hypothetical protein